MPTEHLLSIWQQQIESIWPHSIPEGQEESVLELNRLDSHFFLVVILRSPVWISTMLIATNQISECLHNLGVSSWHFATTVTYIMKTHIMEVMNFCLHNRNLFREMLRRYWKRDYKIICGAKRFKFNQLPGFGGLNSCIWICPSYSAFVDCVSSLVEFAATAQEWSRGTRLWF
jgi:hypothetical protein